MNFRTIASANARLCACALGVSACVVTMLRASAGDIIPDAGPAPILSPLPKAPAAPELAPAQRFNWYVQSTSTQQYHGGFGAPYTGPQSMTSQADTAKTVDATLFVGARIGIGTELYVNAEMDQGFGLGQPPSGPGTAYQGTYGVAGYPTAESYKLGSYSSYGRVQRVFVRQAFDLGGERQAVDRGHGLIRLSQ